MAAAPTNPSFTLSNRPAGYDQTQKRFRLQGALGLAGLYTTSTGIPIDFTAIKNSSGSSVILPPTYDGPNGPGTAIPITAQILAQGGYSMWYDSTNHSIRLWAGTTEVSTGAIPAALRAVTLAINVAGTGYATSDTFSIAGETGMIGTVTAQSGGVPSAIMITTIGAAVAATAAATTAITGVGTGLTVDITVAAGIPAIFEFLRG